MKPKFLFVLVLLSLTAKAQTAKDYFILTGKNNSSVFKSEDPSNKKKFYHNISVFYKDMGDSALVTTMYYRNQDRTGGHEQLVKITESEITVVKGRANTSPGRVENYVADGQTIFRMPPLEGKSEWSDPNQKGAVRTIYVAEFSNIKVNGKETKAVKVSRIEKRKNSGKEFIFYVDYYVAGIGWYKRSSPEGLDIDVLAEQKFDPNPPSVN